MASGSVDRLLDGIQTGIVDPLTGRVYLRDYTHAAKTFLTWNGQGNAGKVKFTFHTYFA